MQSKAMERSSCVSVSPVSLVWVKVHPFSETKQAHHGINLHRDAHQHKPAQRIQERRKRKWWVLTCPAFSMLMSSLGQLFETLNEKETHKIKFSPEQSTWNYKMWLSANALRQNLLQDCGLLPDVYCSGLCAQTGMWKLSCSTCWLDSQMVGPEGTSP